MNVAIGLPVRNGMPYLRQSLDAIVAQSHSDLEIIICDNASTDETPDVCREFAARDGRIRYLRYNEDAGASENFNRAFRASSAPYFSWAAHDDHFAPEYVQACLDALGERPECGMAVPAVRFIDELGEELGVLPERHELSSPDIGTRLRCYLDRHEWFSVYGVARREVLEATTLLTPHFGPDVALMWQVLLQAPVAVIDKPLVAYRRYATKTVNSVMQGLVPSTTVPNLRFPHLGMWWRLWRLTTAVQISTKRPARLALLRWLPSGHFRDLLFEDFWTAAQRARAKRRWLAVLVALTAMGAVRPRRAARGVFKQLRRPSAG